MWEGGPAAVHVSTEGALTIPAALVVGGAPVVQVPAAIASAPVLSGGGAVGQAIALTLGAVTGTPTPASSVSWVNQDGAQVSTNLSSFAPTVAGQYTAIQTADNGVGQPATRMSNTVTVAAGSTAKILPSRFIRAMADSRTAQASEDSTLNRGRRLTSRGYISWFNVAMGYAMEIVVNDGINGETTAGVLNRLTGPNGESTTPGVSPTWRGEILTNTPGGAVPVTTYLGGGTNDQAESMTTWGPKTDTLLKKLIDNPGADGVNRNNGFVLLQNSTPSNNVNGAAAAILLRRDYYDGWPNTSAGMTAEEKSYYGQRVAHGDSYRALAESPDSINIRPEFIYPTDTRHPNGGGSRAQANSLAAAWLPIALANGFQKRNQLPAAAADSLITGAMMDGAPVAIAAAAGETAGAGGANMDGQGGLSLTGAVPSGYSLTRGASLKAVTNAAQPLANGQKFTCVSTIVDVVGADGVTRKGINLKLFSEFGIGAADTAYNIDLRHVTNFNIAALNDGGSATTGDEIRSLCRLQVKANPKGLISHSVEQQWRSSAQTNGGAVSTHSEITPAYIPSEAYPAFDGVLMTPAQPMLAEFVADAATKTSTRILNVQFLGGAPVDIDITYSQFGCVKNR